ncbi:MAG TPA: DUF4129 domain-containing protein, partial [Chloroflexota bacterium]|nr:DUF4129 domain-containing protein [Chloroflexota bacterium]
SEATAENASAPWSQNLPVQRLLALAMFGCVTWAFRDMTISMGMAPTEATATALMAFAVFAAGISLGGREAGRHYRKYTEYSLVDWALLLIPMLLILKLLPRLLEGPGAVGAEISSWMAEPWRFWDVTLVWSLLLVFFVWDYSVQIAELLGWLSFQPSEADVAPAVTHLSALPPAPIEGIYAWSRPPPGVGSASGTPSGTSSPAPPKQRTTSWDSSPYRFVSHNLAWRKLMWAFIFGGFAILLFGGLALVSPQELGDAARSEVGGVVPSVLVYYVLGLVLASQTSLDRLRAEWLRAGATIQIGLTRRWLSYGLLLMLAACAGALLLPTSFAERGTDQFNGGWGLLWVLTSPIRFVLGAVFGALSWMFAYLAALLFAPFASLLPRNEAGPAPPTPPPQAAPLDPGGAATFPSMASQLAWGFLFYVLPSALALYAIWNTWQKRRAIWSGLRGFFRELVALIWGAVLDVATAFWRILGAASPGLLSFAPAAILQRLKQRRSRTGGAVSSAWLRLRGLGPRELIQYFYVSLIQRAASVGWERRTGQTPYEYSRDLAERLPDRRAEVGALTDAFVHAKYSRRPVIDEDAKRARGPWERLRGDLQTRRRTGRVASWFGLGRSE